MYRCLLSKKSNISNLSRCYSVTKPQTVQKLYEQPESSTKIEIKGWVKSLRKLKENIFFDISDGSSNKKLQVVVKQTDKPNTLTVGSSVIVSGKLGSSPKGEIELQAEEVKVCGECVLTDGYPFLPRKAYDSEYVRQYLHLRGRTNKFAALLRLRSATTLAIHQYFNSEGYVNIHTPILTSNDSEGAGEIFTVQPENKNLLKEMVKDKQALEEAYFDGKAFLTVSGQLHLEAMAHGLSKVYTFGPTFRAENSKSRLHLSEFYMLEAEISFVDRIEQLTEAVERLIKNVSEMVINAAEEDLKCCQETALDYLWLDKKFPVLTYNECIAILNKHQDKFKTAFNQKTGLGKEHEIFLAEYCGRVPVFVTHWPKLGKPFYMKESKSEPDRVLALDLLAPNVGEIVGGSLREDNYGKLKAKIPSGSNLDWYLELRKFGGVATAGYGLGFERYLQFITGINNIKDTIPFPRWPHNCRL